MRPLLLPFLLTLAATAAPLPLEVALKVRECNPRSTLDLSPDREWIAHTLIAQGNVKLANLNFTESGCPTAEGVRPMEACLTSTRTGKTVRLGPAGSVSWAPSWSPDGQRVAFYCDHGGSARLWIRDRQGSRPVPGVLVRPYFGYEAPRWSNDGRRLLCKLVPAGMTVAQANARGPHAEGDGFPKAAPEQASVKIRRSSASAAEPQRSLTWSETDLGLVDLEQNRCTRLVSRSPIFGYGFSPDGRRVAYSLRRADLPNSQQATYDLMVIEPGRPPECWAAGLCMAYGIEWNWSPDSRRLAYIESGQLANGSVVVVPGKHRLGDANTPGFDPGDGEVAPVWDATGKFLLPVGGDKLWKLDADSGSARALAPARLLVAPPWMNSLGKTAWVRAGHGFSEVDLETGQERAGFQSQQSILGVFNLDLDPASGEIAFVS